MNRSEILNEIETHCPEMRGFVNHARRKVSRFDILTVVTTFILIIAGWFLVVQWQVG